MDEIHDPILMQKLKSDLELKAEGDLTLEEKLSLQHIRLHEEHKGHENMHLGMIVVMGITVIVSQFLLFLWKRWYFKTYQPASLFALWLIPLMVSLRNLWWRFMSIWIFFTVVTVIMFLKSCQRTIGRHIPRLVYYWFYYVHKITYVSGIVGYIIMGIWAAIYFFSAEWITQLCLSYGAMFLFYGLYFGVLGRDVAAICSDKVAAHLGYYTADGMPLRNLRGDICAVCGIEMTEVSSFMNSEKTYRLNCYHKFHEFCIRGWCIIGKKQTCPCCREKVDMKQLFRNPWEKTHMMYTRLLDFVRYMVSWQPLVLSLVHFINWILGLK